MSKISKNKFGYTSGHYFNGEKTFFVTCAKKRQKNVSYSHFGVSGFVFFAQITKKSFLNKTFYANIKCLEVYPQILF